MGRAFGARASHARGGHTNGEESRETRECFLEKSFLCETSNAERPTSNVQFRVER